ncbi:MAG: hypothetical protein HUU38_12030, partial [Anaerolineales bacterium]|nr:hypothetical protein [Anaerolineales bacterium]
LAIYLGLTGLYLAILRLLSPGERDQPSRPLIPIILLAWLACSGALMTTAPAGESHDIFDYLFRGRMMVEYQANPLAEVPDSYRTKPYIRYVAWQKYVDTYGPVWEMSSAGVAKGVRHIATGLGWWVDDDGGCPDSPAACRLLIMYLTGYRLLAVGLAGVSGGLIWSVVRRNRPSWGALALAGWLLNPMMLISSAVGGHNDMGMLMLVLLSWWLLQRGQLFLACLAIALAAHVKLIALIWLPACAFWIIWRYGWARGVKVGVASAVGALGLSWLLYLPFDGWQTLPRMLHERTLFLANSFWLIFKTTLINAWDWERARAHQWSVGLSGWLFVGGMLMTLLRMFNLRVKTAQTTASAFSPEEADRKLWHALTVVSWLYLLVGSFWFQHWYILWTLAPGVLCLERRFIRVVLPWMAYGALSANVAMNFLQATVFKTAPPMVNYIAAVAMIWGPTTIALLISVKAGWKGVMSHTRSPGEKHHPN